jgi:tetratricopeptide (TPR) repeat protein
VGRLLRSRRKELGLTLQAVSEQMAARGEPFPTSTLVRVEQGKLDPGVRRLHLLLRVYDLPAQLVDDLVELEAIAAEEPEARNLEKLYSEGIEHWKRGDIGKGLAHLFAIRVQTPKDDPSRLIRQKATLAFSIAARDVGKIRLARQLIDDLLCEPPDPTLMARVLIQAASVWAAVGSVEAALAFVRQAASHLKPGDHRELAWVSHQEGKLLQQRGDTEPAGRAIDRAIALYRTLGDTDGEARASIVRIGILEARGDLGKAMTFARKVIRMAERSDNKLALVSARLEVGRLLLRSGCPQPALEELRRAQALAVLMEDRIAEFHAHYYSWKAHKAVGGRDRARFELQAARHFVELIDASTPEAREIRDLAQ